MTTINITNNTGPINNYPSTYIPTKACKRCRTIKQLTEFPKDKRTNDGYINQCKTCKNNYNREYNKEHQNEITKYRKEYYKENKNTLAEYKKEYYNKNKDKILSSNKEYYEQHKDIINDYWRNWAKNQRKINPIFRLITNNRARIRTSLKSNSKTTNTIELL